MRREEGFHLAAHGLESLVGFIENEERAAVVDEVVDLFNLLFGLGVDEEGHFSHFDSGDFGNDFGFVESEDQFGGTEPAPLHGDFGDGRIGDLDELHLSRAAGEDIAFDAPMKVNVVA